MTKRAKLEALYGGKADKPAEQQDAKPVKTKKATYYMSEDALMMLETERYERRKAGNAVTFSQLMDEAVRAAYGKKR